MQTFDFVPKKICIVHKDIYLLHFQETSYKFSKYILCRGKANTIKKKCIYAYFYVINIISICLMDLFMFFLCGVDRILA